VIFTGILVGAVLLDLLFGDPSWLPHPVVIIGKLIDKLESIMRKRIDEKELSDSERQKALRRAGKLLTATVVLTTLIFTTAISVLAWLVSPWLFLAVQVFWGFQSLAIKGLVSESKNVYMCLTGKASKTKKKPEEETSHGIKRFDATEGFESKQDRLVAARKAVGRIVGRDTSELSEEGVTKATVETVAENFADGVLAPLLYLAIGGAPLALTYKAVNTMDSMLGYKNEKYIDFGRASAKLDDFCGFAPARLAAGLGAGDRTCCSAMSGRSSPWRTATVWWASIGARTRRTWSLFRRTRSCCAPPPRRFARRVVRPVAWLA